ncbi:MAG TPA: LytTR family DNA-binding domain-containing protein [Gammaproteobacteria bacterium]|nr:LytTR family DNA-binding domain-containing protein [Gammaproteobacteria bacterium]
MSSFPIRVVIADDEPLARRGLRQLLADDADIRIVGEARDGKEVARLLRSLSPDLVFLDVQMPELDGIAALRSIDQKRLPQVIFVTAYDRFAVDAFEVHAVDYLVKPVSKARFKEALSRAKERLASVEALLEVAKSGGSPRQGASRLVIHTADGDSVINVADVTWIRAFDYYAAIHTIAGHFLIRESLSSLEKRLDSKRFVRTHRTAIVNLAFVHSISSNVGTEPIVELHDGTHVLLSRRRRKDVKSALRRFGG